KLGRDLYITVVSGAGSNYYLLMPYTGILRQVVTYNSDSLGGLTPIEAQNIDAKLDDGMPNTGTVVALYLISPWIPGSGTTAGLIGGQEPSFAATSTHQDCVIGTGAAASDTYNRVASTGGNDMSCALAIRFQ